MQQQSSHARMYSGKYGTEVEEYRKVHLCTFEHLLMQLRHAQRYMYFSRLLPEIRKEIINY